MSKVFQFHEAADLFPMDKEHLDELAADIAEHGQRVPVELFDGKIIDGRRRYTACGKRGIEPKTVVVSVDDPVAYVMSLNLHRRHLTPSQRAMVGARARELYDRQAKERQRLSEGAGKKGVVTLPPLSEGKSRDKAGKAAGVSGTYIDRATKVLANGTPELVTAVDEGRMSVTTAAVLTSEPPEVQRAEATKPKRNRTYNSVSAPMGSPEDTTPNDDEPDTPPTLKGVGVIRANEAINCLMRIPKNDALRKRGFQVVTDWIKRNK